ncbi:MAG: hypothetical protein U0361_05680 [Nitrospiraceae bacterium]
MSDLPCHFPERGHLTHMLKPFLHLGNLIQPFRQLQLRVLQLVVPLRQRLSQLPIALALRPLSLRKDKHQQSRHGEIHDRRHGVLKFLHASDRRRQLFAGDDKPDHGHDRPTHHPHHISSRQLRRGGYDGQQIDQLVDAAAAVRRRHQDSRQHHLNQNTDAQEERASGEVQTGFGEDRREEFDRLQDHDG